MTRFSNAVAGTSSTLQRLIVLFFLRWVPGHVFPPVIYILAAFYFTSFFRSLLTNPQFDVLSDEINILAKESDAQTFESSNGVSLAENAKDGPIEEIDITETVTWVEKDPAILKTLLLGIPSPVSSLWSVVTATINLVLILMTLDLVYRGPLFFAEKDLSFGRVGFVSYDSAKILVREPDAKQWPVFLSYRSSGIHSNGVVGSADVAWKPSGQVKELGSDTDFTTSFTISSLKPDTQYQYALSNNHSGYFFTAPRPGQSSARHDGSFVFLTTSCIKAHFPYNPLDHPLHIPGLTHLANLIPKLLPQFMLFLGDFIYIDVPHRFGIDRDTYRAEYRRVYASPSWPAATESLPWIHVIDDHEIANDWDKNTTGVYAAAVDPWMHYQAAVNPPPVRKGETYFSFSQGPASFFMADTRRYRTRESSNATDASKSMLGAAQLADLLAWIRAPPPRGVKWKLIASSVPFTKNWRFGDDDTWAKYLVERGVILEAMWAAGFHQGVGMVVISGDRHEFAATRFKDPKNRGADVVEFSVSPMSMFYVPKETYKQTDDEDEMIEYIPNGNFKFGAIELFPSAPSARSVLHYRLFIDGKLRWSHVMQSPRM